jgi:hypothetical protein
VAIEIPDIWKCLHQNEVKYLTIGGFAVNFYGYSRVTGDIDLLIEDSLQNRKRLRQFLKELGVGDFKEIEYIEFIPGWTDFSLDYGIRLDVMTSIKGFSKEDFDELYRLSEVTMLSDIPVRFIDYHNLILSKKAANRPKDQLDIEEMEKIKKWKDENHNQS